MDATRSGAQGDEGDRYAKKNNSVLEGRDQWTREVATWRLADVRQGCGTSSAPRLATVERQALSLAFARDSTNTGTPQLHLWRCCEIDLHHVVVIG